jgi:hypothetical protein
MVALALGVALPLCKNVLPVSVAAAASSVFRVGMAIDEGLIIVLLVIFLALGVKWAVTKTSDRQGYDVPASRHSSTPKMR